MKSKGPALIMAVAFLLLTALTPKAALAVDLIVEHHPTDPSHFSTIQSAIDYANNLLSGPSPTTTNFRVLVEADPSPYSGPITPISNVPIIGSETARTFISGSTTGALITVNNVTNVTIKNFTIINAATGISVSNSTQVNITANVFQAGASGTAVQVQNSPSTSVVNNTFYQNGTAISTGSDILITNNIFSTNSTAISNQIALTQITYNDFFNNSIDGNITLDVHSIPNTTATNPDPLFVDPANRDFHLKAGSPCHMYGGVNAGNPNYPNVFDGTTFDMGAYGGKDSDTIPFQISNVVSSLTSTTSISLSWNPNNSYLVNGYHVYYGTASGNYNGTGATEGNSPITVSVGTTTATLSNLLSSAVTPSVPTNISTSPLNQSLVVNWSASPGATGYKVYYSTSLFDSSSLPSTFDLVDGGGTTTHTISNLTNGQTYHVAVSAVAQFTYHVAVTAFNSPSGPFEPGISNESAYSQEVSQSTGAPQESAISIVVNDFPEASIPYPNLPNSHQGCFIATAAYDGYYSAPQVQALRAFRDQYLLTNGPGSAFVKWYYTYGPAAAAWLIAHPGYKPLVRAALLPAVGMALFMTKTSLALKFGCVMMIAACLVAYAFYRKRLSGHGGPR